jgi:hypothetical protein
MKRRLTLRTERLTELSRDDLGSVAGGTTTTLFTGYYPSINAPCTSVLTEAINWPKTAVCK